MLIIDPQHTPEPCVATIGFFDGLHIGHQHLLRQVCSEAARRGLRSLAITFTNHPRTVTSPDFVPQLLTTWPEREALLAQTGIDYLLPLAFDSTLAAMTARQFMEQIIAARCHARVLLIGYDHRFGHDRAEGFADYLRYGRELGMEVKPVDALPPLHGITASSTVIRRALLRGDVEEATLFLGRPYELAGTVATGLQQGRKIGFPTANVTPPAEKLVPRDGVYLAQARCLKAAALPAESGSTFAEKPCHFSPAPLPFSEPRLAVVNIGDCPTVRTGMSYRTVEAHLPGFSGNLYGATLSLRFLQRMRDQQKFSSIDELRQQLERDCRKAQEIYAARSADSQSAHSTRPLRNQ